MRLRAFTGFEEAAFGCALLTFVLGLVQVFRLSGLMLEASPVCCSAPGSRPGGRVPFWSRPERNQRCAGIESPDVGRAACPTHRQAPRPPGGLEQWWPEALSAGPPPWRPGHRHRARPRRCVLLARPGCARQSRRWTLTMPNGEAVQVGLSEPAGRASHRLDAVQRPGLIGKSQPFFFGDFLLWPKKKVTRPPGRNPARCSKPAKPPASSLKA
jgi:hypothetical protein